MVTPCAARTGMDESLMVALPATCQKMASERGAFDQMVIEQLECQMNQKIETLANLVVNSEAARNEHAKSAEAAKQRSDATAAHLKAALLDLDAAKSAKSEALKALEEAK